MGLSTLLFLRHFKCFEARVLRTTSEQHPSFFTLHVRRMARYTRHCVLNGKQKDLEAIRACSMNVALELEMGVRLGKRALAGCVAACFLPRHRIVSSPVLLSEKGPQVF